MADLHGDHHESMGQLIKNSPRNIHPFPPARPLNHPQRQPTNTDFEKRLADKEEATQFIRTRIRREAE